MPASPVLALLPSAATAIFFTAAEACLAVLCREKGWTLITDKPTCIRIEVSTAAHIDVPLYAIPDEEFHTLAKAAMGEILAKQDQRRPGEGPELRQGEAGIEIHAQMIRQGEIEQGGGQGRMQKEKQLSVNIPQGVETGTRIRLAGEGEAGELGFDVGPIDLTLKRGELVFLVGGNGSGKSTLARLLTGLHRPDSGAIRLDGRALNEDEWPAYRQLFASVFTDFHLFARLLGPAGSEVGDGLVKGWLERLHMAHKARLGAGRLLDTRFSQGQRKRLALLLAMLEGRDILVLDEWAADQDPLFRRLFYRELLPQLKAAGKTVLAITHDDHYFDQADRLLKMDGGQLFELTGEQRQRASADALHEIGGPARRVEVPDIS